MQVLDSCKHHGAVATSWRESSFPEHGLEDRRHYLRKMLEVVLVHHVFSAHLPALGYLAPWKEERRYIELSQAEKEFDQLATSWRNDTAHLSSLTRIVMHQSYQQIIGMGQKAVPIILRRLQERPEFWFWALHSITREDPVPPGDPGNVRKMRDAWLEWGKERGLL